MHNSVPEIPVDEHGTILLLICLGFQEHCWEELGHSINQIFGLMNKTA